MFPLQDSVCICLDLEPWQRHKDLQALDCLELIDRPCPQRDIYFPVGFLAFQVVYSEISLPLYIWGLSDDPRLGCHSFSLVRQEAYEARLQFTSQSENEYQARLTSLLLPLLYPCPSWSFTQLITIFLR